MTEQEQRGLYQELRKPFHEGEFLQQAAALEGLAASVEQMHWNGQTVADIGALKAAAAEMRQLALGFYRSEWLLSPTKKTTAEPVQPASAIDPAGSAPAEVAEGNPEKQKPVSFLGQLALPVQFRTTTRGKHVAECRVGVRDAEGHLSWETVLTQNEAEVQQLRQAGLKKDDPVRVIGAYVRERSYTTRRGQTRHVREFWATKIRPLSPQP